MGCSTDIRWSLTHRELGVELEYSTPIGQCIEMQRLQGCKAALFLSNTVWTVITNEKQLMNLPPSLSLLAPKIYYRV